MGDTGDLFCLEINARRTGGTHVHEVGHRLLGKDYLQHSVLLSNTSMDSNGISEFSKLQAKLEPLLYPMGERSQGLIMTHTSGLKHHKFGYVIVAPTGSIALDLQQQMMTLLG